MFLFAHVACLRLQSALCSSQFGGSASPDSMQRITARFLLLIALLGTVVPIAMQAKATPPHACCLRKGPHQCHDSAAAHSDGPVLRDAGCCDHNSCHAVASSHWAHPQPSLNAVFAHDAIGCTFGDPGNQTSTASPSLLRSRAPPLFILA